MPGPGSIVLLTHEFHPFRGGAATYVQEIAAAAARCGIGVEVWAPDRGSPPPRRAFAFPVRWLPGSGKLGLGIAGLAWEVWKRRGDLAGRRVWLLSVGAHRAWALLGLRQAGQVGAFFHGSEVLKFGRSRRMKRFYARVDRYGAASEYVAGLVRASPLARAGTPLILAPCAVSPSLMSQPVPRPPGDGRFRLLTVGRLHPRKGQLEMARALSLLPPVLRERIVYQLAGTGDEPYRRAVEQACEAAGVVAEFLGAVGEAQLAAAYAGCDVYGQSSRTLAHSVEGFGISYLEAAAFGRPSVGVETGGVREAVLDGITGLLAPEGNPAALAAAVERLMADPALGQRLGAAARGHAARFDWETSARALFADAAPEAFHPDGEQRDVGRSDSADAAGLP